METDNIELKIKGKLSTNTIENFSVLSDLKSREDILFLFVDFASQDIPINSSFFVIKSSNEKDVRCSSQVVRITQQYNRPFDIIPRGWKTIIALKIIGEKPTILKNMNEIEDWYDKNRSPTLTLIG